MAATKKLGSASVARYLWELDGKPEGHGLGEANRQTYIRQAEEVFNAIGAMGFKVVPKKAAPLPAMVEDRGGALAHVLRYSDMTHEADDPRGPWWPIKDGKFTKRYVQKKG